MNLSPSPPPQRATSSARGARSAERISGVDQAGRFRCCSSVQSL